MSRKKAPPLVDRTEDGDGQIRLDGFEVLPEDNSIISFQAPQGSIAEILSHGRENALTTRDLARITGQKPRDVTRSICAERRAGAPILSDTCGFWLAEDAAELRRCTAALHRRAGEIHRTARALEKIVGRG